MKATTGKTITSPNLDPSESWKVYAVDSAGVNVRAKSDRSFTLRALHGTYTIVS